MSCLIVQSDKTLLLEVDHELADACRRAIAPFAELERAPEHIHTYRVTPLALWNARAAGHDAEQVVDALVSHSRFAVPQALLVDMIAIVAKNLKKGEKVRIGGLGIFEVKKRAARKGRNPATGEAIKIKASKRVAFKALKELKESI